LALAATPLERALQIAATLRGPPVQLAQAAPVEELRPLVHDRPRQRGQPFLDGRSSPLTHERRSLPTDELPEARPIAGVPEHREGGSCVAGILGEAGGGPALLDELRWREPVPTASQEEFAEQGMIVIDGLAVCLFAGEIVLAVKTLEDPSRGRQPG